MQQNEKAAQPGSVSMLDVHAGLVAHAMILSEGYCSSMSAYDCIHCKRKEIAALAHDMAEAMMAERARRMNGGSVRDE